MINNDFLPRQLRGSLASYTVTCFDISSFNICMCRTEKKMLYMSSVKIGFWLFDFVLFYCLLFLL